MNAGFPDTGSSTNSKTGSPWRSRMILHPRRGRMGARPSSEQEALLRARFRPSTGRRCQVNRGLAAALGVTSQVMYRWARELRLDGTYVSSPLSPASPAAGVPAQVLVRPPTDPAPAVAPTPHGDPVGEDGQPILSQALKERISARVREIAGQAAVQIAREQAREVVRDFMASEFPEMVQRAIDEAAHRIARQAVRELLTAVVSAAVE